VERRKGVKVELLEGGKKVESFKVERRKVGKDGKVERWKCEMWKGLNVGRWKSGKFEGKKVESGKAGKFKGGKVETLKRGKVER
jgi:hypothetical protein